ncbi:hypothetical protein ES707_09566 [subsurface metagenome]
MCKMSQYFAEHANYNSCVHVCVGLGIAWLISLAWGYSVLPLVLGIVFIVIGIAGHIYPLLAKQ